MMLGYPMPFEAVTSAFYVAMGASGMVALLCLAAIAAALVLPRRRARASLVQIGPSRLDRQRAA